MRELDYKILSHIEKYKCLTSKQAARMFYDGDYARDKAGKKLRLMEQNMILESYTNSITKEKVYFVQDKMSAHDLYILDFYSLLVYHSCTEIKMEIQPKLMNDMLRPDAYINFEYEGYIYNVLLEIDLTHFSTSKLPLYIKLKREDWLKERCEDFQIVIVGANDIKRHYEGVDINYLNFNMDNFKKVLGYE